MKRVHAAHGGASNQEGAALIVVLMLLLIVTILGIASMRGAIMQERMAANTTARSMAFQAAEAGLRQAEIIVRDGTLSFPTSGCSAGRCADASWSNNPTFWTSGAGFQSGSAVQAGQHAITPRFIIEDYGRAAPGDAAAHVDMSKPPPVASSNQRLYRVTAYAAAPNGVEVVLQSLYQR